MYNQNMLNLSRSETKLFQRLNSPAKIQDFLNIIPFNFEKQGETCYSPRLVLKKKKAHCLEGAVLAAAILKFHRQRPLILDLRSADDDFDHVIALFGQGKYWGAISKTNHAVLRYREPVYQSVRELVMSYFHEYFLDDGRKTLRSYSQVVNLSRFDKQNWITADKEIWYIDEYLDDVKYYSILPRGHKLRKADKVEIRAGKITEWKN